MAYKKTEQYDEAVTSGLITNYKSVLDLLGEDAQREGLIKTPERIAKAMRFFRTAF
jgi:GTP cyclohydrolase I